ncbi:MULTISPECIES: hypothetical protein [Nostoc]|uniref:Uncharacterized protein n=2 Tax=Nostoc TaxID=1177 RepID=A0ABR8IIL7_9NOSO|nr:MULTISPECIES: hypothetical protein [Nostoc]MBD2565045.1 hypothetical protein [Nostoc linckia FACHB-391]MBD2650583.1 hypothetical protein [Nostoc foliaceum FACHB-393]
MVNNIGCLVVQYFRIGETKGCLINLIVKLTGVTGTINCIAFSEPNSLVVSRHEPLEHLPSKFCCVPADLPKIGVKYSWVCKKLLRLPAISVVEIAVYNFGLLTAVFSEYDVLCICFPSFLRNASRLPL